MFSFNVTQVQGIPIRIIEFYLYFHR
eukprot:Gb_37302 [translate_table: standard]